MTTCDPNMEPILDKLGLCGKYQLSQILLQIFGIFAISFPVMIAVFTGYEPSHICNEVSSDQVRERLPGLNNVTLEMVYSKCEVKVTWNATEKETTHNFDCINGNNYSTPKDVSFVTEMDLVCDSVGLGELTTTMLMLGQGIGCLIFTPLADWVGRKPVLVFSAFGMAIHHIAIAAAPEVVSLTFFRFVIGMLQQGVGVTSFTLFIEMMPKRHRELGSVACGTLWSTSIMILGVLAWLLQDYSWRTLQYIVTSSCTYTLLLPFCLSESPRWLACNKRMDDALSILKRWCGWNGRDFGEIKELFEEHVRKNVGTTDDQKVAVDQESTGSEEVDVPKYSLLDIFRHRYLIVSSVILWFAWLTACLTYFSLTLTSSSLAGNRFDNFLLSSVAEWPSHAVAYLTLKRFKRKQAETSFLLLSAVSLFISVLLLLSPEQTAVHASTGFSLVGKFAITAAFNSLFLYTPELYPTNLRSAGLGLASGISRFGAMVAPYSRFLAEKAVYGPGTLFGLMCIVSALLLQFLPETKGKPLPNKIEDVKKLWKPMGRDMDENTEENAEAAFPLSECCRGTAG